MFRPTYTRSTGPRTYPRGHVYRHCRRTLVPTPSFPTSQGQRSVPLPTTRPVCRVLPRGSISGDDVVSTPGMVPGPIPSWTSIVCSVYARCDSVEIKRPSVSRTRTLGEDVPPTSTVPSPTLVLFASPPGVTSNPTRATSFHTLGGRSERRTGTSSVVVRPGRRGNTLIGSQTVVQGLLPTVRRPQVDQRGVVPLGGRPSTLPSPVSSSST